MATLRARLTVAYGFALVGNVLLFAGALYFAHNARGLQMKQLGRAAVDESDRTLSLIRAAAREGRTLTEPRPCGGQRDRMCTFATSDLVDLLDRVPGYYLVYDKDDRQIYSSVGIRMLSDDDQLNVGRAAVKLVPDSDPEEVSVAEKNFGG